MSKIVFFAGSFDPFTNGHLHVVKVAAGIFEEVVIGIGYNCCKTRRYDREEMKYAIEQVLRDEGIVNGKVVCYDTLTSVAAIAEQADFLVRGIRNHMDYEYEEQIALYNQERGIDTIYLRAGAAGAISSSMVVDRLTGGEDISEYVPSAVQKLLVRGRR